MKILEVVQLKKQVPTIDEMIKILENARKSMGGNAKVLVSIHDDDAGRPFGIYSMPADWMTNEEMGQIGSKLNIDIDSDDINWADVDVADIPEDKRILLLDAG